MKKFHAKHTKFKRNSYNVLQRASTFGLEVLAPKV